MTDRLSIFTFIAERNSSAAKALDTVIEARAEQLVSLPRLGRLGKIEGTRELTVHRNYRLIYEIRGMTVIILNIVHASRNWPPEEAPQ